MLPRLALTFICTVLLCPVGTFAQTVASQDRSTASNPSVYEAPAYVAFVDGNATLEREGKTETAPLNMPLLSGDRVKTADGRVEIRFADGSSLHLDSYTTIDVQSDDLLRLIDGRLRVNILGSTRTVAYRIDSSAGSVRIAQPGEYRVALLRGPAAESRETQIEFAVLRGSGEVFTDEGSTSVRAGERAYASAGLMPSYAYTYNSAAMDAFDRWSEDRRDTRLGVSTQYLPQDMRGYASTFDTYGDWRYEQTYGYVWYPRVAADWRPYYYGRWATYPHYGYTWIAADRFGWPTHHYGRWGFDAGLWFWIPSRSWAPAYVSWAYAPDYVSWCPLGWDNQPIISVNIFNFGPGYYHVGPRYYSAWTIVSRSHFGRGWVNERAVNWERLDRNRRPRFSPGRPSLPYDVAVPRGSAPIRYAGSRSVPPDHVRQGSGGQPGDGSSPRYINRGDEIVRSQTERPTPPRRGDAGAPDRAIERTIPDRPARRADDSHSGAPVTTSGGLPRANGGARSQDPSRSYEPSRASEPFDAAQGRPSRAYDPSRASQPSSGARDRAIERGAPQPERRAEPREEPVYRQPMREAGPRGYERPDRPGDRPERTYERPDARPSSAAQPMPSHEARPMPSPSAGMPDGGGGARPPAVREPQGAPSHVEGRERSAPAPRETHAAPPSAPRETAVPRSSSGGAAAPRRGRGGA